MPTCLYEVLLAAGQLPECVDGSQQRDPTSHFPCYTGSELTSAVVVSRVGRSVTLTAQRTSTFHWPSSRIGLG